MAIRPPEQPSHVLVGVPMDAQELLISADSHVLEPADLWEKRLPASLRDRAPRVYFDEARGTWMFGSADVYPQPITFSFVAGVDLDELPAMHKAGYAAARPGGWDPQARLEDMAIDGVSAEVLYPSLGLMMYWIEDAAFQEACFRAFNDWLIEYCAAVPDRLIGVAMVSLWDPDRAAAEVRRCAKAGLKGVMPWERPPEGHEFWREELDPFWAACQECEMPVSLHILTDWGITRRRVVEAFRGRERFRSGVAQNFEIETALFDIVFGGVLERFPRLQVVSVENEYAWLGGLIQRMDRYFERFRREQPTPLTMRPSDYYRRQIYATFFNDPVGPLTLPYLGYDNLMWSSDYPHQNSTWPHSRQVIARDLAQLAPENRAKLLSGNVRRLYNLPVPALLSA